MTPLPPSFPNFNGPATDYLQAEPVADSDMKTISIDPSRRSDIEDRQMELARMLVKAGCDWCILFEPENIRWLTGGMQLGLNQPGTETPVLFCNLIQRCVVASSLDSSAVFQSDLDELGFSLKEYHWSVPREEFLTRLLVNRKVASDRPFHDCLDISDALNAVRPILSAYESIWYTELGRILGHALEATGRNLEAGETELQIAGQLSHRLLKHGVHPVAIQILADDRVEKYPRAYPSAAIASQTVFLQATAHYKGLFATASRTVCLTRPGESWKQQYDNNCRMQSILRSQTRIKACVASVIAPALQLILPTANEHDWRRTSLGYLTGRRELEVRWHPLQNRARFQEYTGIVWDISVGETRITDTGLLTSTGWQGITGVQEWPQRKVRLGDNVISLPDFLPAY